MDENYRRAYNQSRKSAESAMEALRRKPGDNKIMAAAEAAILANWAAFKALHAGGGCAVEEKTKVGRPEWVGADTTETIKERWLVCNACIEFSMTRTILFEDQY